MDVAFNMSRAGQHFCDAHLLVDLIHDTTFGIYSWLGNYLCSPFTLGGIPKWFLSAPTCNALPALIWPYIEKHACLQGAQGVLVPFC